MDFPSWEVPCVSFIREALEKNVEIVDSVFYSKRYILAIFRNKTL
jgi:hypothetical protein